MDTRLESFNALLRSPQLITRQEFRSKQCPVPKQDGIYAWFFNDEIPNLDTSRCLRINGRLLLYIGIARESERSNPEKRHLRARLTDHFSRNAGSSTLRYSLGSALAEALQIELRMIGCGRKIWANKGESRLDTWMDQHAFVTWLPMERPWEVEPLILQSDLYLPFNIEDHCGIGSPVSILRAKALTNAKSLPNISADSGR